MPVITYKDIEINYEFSELIPTMKVFHQDLFTISPDSDTKIRVYAEGQAKTDLEGLGYNHPNGAYSQNRFNETCPTRMPSYNYLTCETLKKKFPYPDILESYGIIGPNQLLVSYRLMGIFQKFRMAPHITVPAVIKFRDTYIEDNYLVLYFYHHGCDHVVWDKTVFGYTKGIIRWDLINTFNFDSFLKYKEFANNPPDQTFKLLKLTMYDEFDIFYSTIASPLIIVSNKIINEVKVNKINGAIFRHGGEYEVSIISKD